MGEKKDSVYIWGTGRMGEAAYRHFRDEKQIIGFIDSNPGKWKTTFHEIPVYAPAVLADCSEEVIVALKNGLDSVRKELEGYGIHRYLIFEIKETVINEPSQKIKSMGKDPVIIRFAGGLGNQMFQYAVYRNYELQNKNVHAITDNNSSAGMMPFVLTEVFPNIRLKRCSGKDIRSCIDQFFCNERTGLFCMYSESRTRDVERKSYDPELLTLKSGYLRGNFQCHQYAGQIRDTLFKDFRFAPREDTLKEWVGRLKEDPASVGIHVRRGDYLSETNAAFYGNICTPAYYQQAVKAIREKVGEPHFFVFSDDLKWCRKNLPVSDAVFMDQTRFGDYEDWYDMCLLSACRHQIIANSTFSWWGAWLNDNSEKTVIAPGKWINGCEYTDVYPPEWIRI